jgi:hypothetical protein
MAQKFNKDHKHVVVSDNEKTTLRKHAIGSKFGHPLTQSYYYEVENRELPRTQAKKTGRVIPTNITNLRKQDNDHHIYVPIGSTAGETIPE